MLKNKKKKGQSTLEYLVLVTAVIAVLLIFTNGIFKTRVTATLDSATNAMTNMAGRLATSQPLSP